MPDTEQCPLCKTNCVIERLDSETISVRCPTCGDYIAPFRIKFAFVNCGNSHLISGVTRNYYEINKTPFKITGQMISDSNSVEFQTKILSQEPKTVLGKAELLLQYINRKSEYPGDVVSINPSQDYPICFCKKAEELIFYIKSLNEIGYVKVNGSSQDYSLSLTAEGWQKVESMTKPNIESKQAFVAMWFDNSMDAIFADGIKSIEKDTGFSMFRVDKTYFIDEKICDKIIAEIKKSRFLIADVTKQRQAVYFEAGYAMGMGLPIIWTCKESEVNNCCFDTRQYPHIIWKDAEDLRNQLKEKILATINKPEK
jgi:hypothetical protein